MAQNNSGIASSDDMTPNGKQIKTETDESGFSLDDPSTSFPVNPSHQQEKKTSYKLRSSTLRLFEVKFKEGSGYTSCQSNGRETIKDMLIKSLSKTEKEKLHIASVILKRDHDDCAINLGLPTDQLKNDVRYTCTFRTKKVGTFTECANMRKYNVENFEKDWNMGCFYIELDRGRQSQPNVGDIKKKANMIQIDFFPGETLYKAIFRDGRLKIKNNNNELFIKKWYFKKKDKVVSIDQFADSYKDIRLKLFRKKQPDHTLPDNVKPLLEPGVQGETSDVPGSSSQVVVNRSMKVEIVKNSEKESSKEDSVCSDTQTTNIIKLCTDKDCEDFFEQKFHFKFEKQEKQSAEKKRISKINNVFKKNYDLFASQKGHANLVSKMKDFVEMSNSVGAVVVELESGEKHFMGTCFVISAKCVITNSHVIEKTKNKTGFKDFYIDFEYGDGGGHKFRFSHDPVVSSPVNVQLDYAILKLCDSGNDGKELPPSLSKCGYVIPTVDHYVDADKQDEWVALVGYPGGMKKVMEDSCPLKHPYSLHRDVVLALSRIKPADLKVLGDTRRQTYDTGTFFHGSSGSPGVILNEKLLVLLHCRGFHLHDENHSIIEQGVRMSAIRDDVEYKINSGGLKGMKLSDIFDKFSPELKEELMDIDSN